MKLMMGKAVFLSCFVFSFVLQPAVDAMDKLATFGTKTRYIDSLSKELKLIWGLGHVPQTVQRLGSDGYVDRIRTESSSSLQNGIETPKIPTYLNDICSPVHIQFIGRHGIRNPGQSDIRTIQGLIASLSRLGIDSKLFKNLKNSADRFSVESEKVLAQAGWDELYGIGLRLALRFPEIFKSVEDEADLVFQVTSKSRTVDSCRAFASALEDLHIPISKDFTERDDLLRFFDHCEKYLIEVEENKHALNELHKFREIHFPRIGSSIHSKLGPFEEDFQLTPKEVKAIYIMAASELAVSNSSSWLQLLEADDLLKLEYAADLKNYWKKSYGYPINYEQSCNFFNDILQHIQAAAYNKRFKRGVFSFAHAETFLPLVSLMGLFKDSTHPTADNFHDQSNRKFRTSQICPFASNLALILYSCDVEKASKVDEVYDELGLKLKTPPSWDTHMIRLLFKEENMAFPFCDSHLCSLETLMQHYSKVLSKCHWDQMCNSHKDEL